MRSPVSRGRMESLEVPSSNQPLGEMTPAQAGPMGWRRPREQRPAVKAGAEVRNNLETASAAAEAPLEWARQDGLETWRERMWGGKAAQPGRRPGPGLDREVGVTSQSKGYARETMLVEEGAESLLSFPRNHAGDRIYLCV